MLLPKIAENGPKLLIFMKFSGFPNFPISKYLVQVGKPGDPITNLKTISIEILIINIVCQIRGKQKRKEEKRQTATYYNKT